MTAVLCASHTSTVSSCTGSPKGGDTCTIQGLWATPIALQICMIPENEKKEKTKKKTRADCVQYTTCGSLHPAMPAANTDVAAGTVRDDV